MLSVPSGPPPCTGSGSTCTEQRTPPTIPESPSTHKQETPTTGLKSLYVKFYFL